MYLRFSLLLYALAVFLALPAAIVFKTNEFFSSKRVDAAVEWGIAGKGADYPNITLCHPKFFDARKMESERKQSL